MVKNEAPKNLSEDFSLSVDFKTKKDTTKVIIDAMNR